MGVVDATSLSAGGTTLNRISRAAVTAPVLGLATVLAAAAPVSAADHGSVRAVLAPINDDNAKGTATASISGTTLTVTVAAEGLLADMPHAAHIHFGADARHECPTMAEDTDGNGRINTTEGAPAYGPVVVSLTKTGDTSPASTLAVDRFDTASGGTMDYKRGSITVSSTVAKAIKDGESVVVVHGVDYNGDGKYSGAEKSDLDPSLPTEATDPAVCGPLRAWPAGGVAAGAGSTNGVESPAMLVGGIAALLGGAVLGGTALLARRRRLDNGS